MTRSPQQQSWLGRCFPLLAAIATLALAPSAAQATPEHPKLRVSGEVAKTNMPPHVAVGWGMLQVKNRYVGTVECVNLDFAKYFNNTEPGRAGLGTESIRAYGEILGWSAASFANAAGLEPRASCKSSQGLLSWWTAEPPPQLSTEIVRSINGTPTERLAITGPFGGSASHREPSSLPWLVESQASENAGEDLPVHWAKTGIAANTGERLRVEDEEALAGVSTERRTGCYHFPALTEVVREPGYQSSRETELALRSAPQGCIKVTLAAPEEGLEVPFQGTLEPEAVNGSRPLTPSSGSFHGGFIGTEVENSSEHLERALTSVLGPAYVRSITPFKQVGYLRQELLNIS